MEISLRLQHPIDSKIQEKVEKFSGFDFYLDDFEDDNEEANDNYYHYYLGDSNEEDDCFPLENLLPVMGLIHRLLESYLFLGITDWENWAISMIFEKDFSGYALSDESRAYYQRNSDLFWSEAEKKDYCVN